MMMKARGRDALRTIVRLPRQSPFSSKLLSSSFLLALFPLGGNLYT
jgi:hypothetical protein